MATCSVLNDKLQAKIESETAEPKQIGNVQVLSLRKKRCKKQDTSLVLFSFYILVFSQADFQHKTLSPAMISLLTWFLNRLSRVTPENILRSFSSGS